MKSNNLSIESSESFKDRYADTLQFRLDFIKILLKNSKLEPMVDMDDTSTENYMNPYINKKSINGNNARYVLNKKIMNFSSVITDIGGKLEYIKSGTTGHAFKGHIMIENKEIINFGVKVVAYPKKENYGNINDIRRPENAELMMIKLLSQFVIKKQTPYIILPIATFNTPIETFVRLTKDGTIPEKTKNGATDQENKKFVEFVKKYNNGEYYGNVSILLCEWANRGDLLSYIRKYYKEFTLNHWKVIFFQIISVLAVIQHKYPSFRHNDLKANNILIHRVKDKSDSMEHVINDYVYKVPSIGFFIKLWDFDFACIPNVVNNQKVSDEWTTRLNIDPVKNRYYDIHYFFNTLMKKSFFPQFTEGGVPKEVFDFVNRIVPPKFQKGKYMVAGTDKRPKGDRIALDIEYKIPEEILRTDEFFAEFRRGSRKPTSLKITNILNDNVDKIDNIDKINKIEKIPEKRHIRYNIRSINMKKDIVSKNMQKSKKDGILYINLQN